MNNGLFDPISLTTIFFANKNCLENFNKKKLYFLHNCVTIGYEIYTYLFYTKTETCVDHPAIYRPPNH